MAGVRPTLSRMEQASQGARTLACLAGVWVLSACATVGDPAMSPAESGAQGAEQDRDRQDGVSQVPS